jgi:hypothetical protein
VPAPGQSRKLALIGALDHAASKLIVHRSRTKRSSDFIALLERLDPIYGPRPGRATKPVVVVRDNGPIHISKASRAALERSWRYLKRHFLAHQTFRSVEELDAVVETAVDRLNQKRRPNVWHNQLIAA